MKKLIIALYIIAFGYGCTMSQDEIEVVLEQEGLHDVQTGGYAMFECSDDDQFKTEFTAYRTVLNSDGSPYQQEVSGAVCCGLWKDCTVRYSR